MTNRDDNNLIEPDTREIAAMMDRLGHADGQGLSAQAMDRIAKAAAGSPRLKLTETEVVVARHQFSRIMRPMRVAAAFLLTATVGIVTYSMIAPSRIVQPIGPTDSTETSFVEDTLALLDSGSSSEITNLLNEVDTLSASINTGDRTPTIDTTDQGTQ